MTQIPASSSTTSDVIATGRKQPEVSLRVAEVIAIGIAMEAIYLLYVIAYPLVYNTQGANRIYDLEQLTSDRQWFAGVYFGAMLLLFYLFWRATHRITEIVERSANTSLVKILILAFGIIFGLTLIWLYPVNANDLFRYVLRGRVWAVYGESPMLSPPNNFPNDPYILFAGEFGDWVSGYGPVWEILTQVPLRLGATDVLSGSIGLKFLALLFYVASAGLLGWLAWPARRGRREAGAFALLVFAWNPMVLLEGLGNGHNDMVLMAFMVLGVVLWTRRLWLAATVALSLGALTKATGFLMLPLFAMALLSAEERWRRRVLKGIVATVTFLALVYLLYSSVGPISETLRGVTDMLTLRRGYAIASALRVILREILPRQIAEPIPRTAGRYLFVLFYAGLLVQVWRRKLNLPAAAFLAYFAQLMLGRTFRIWYPIWLIPLAALCPLPSTYWRMFLFALSGELYVLNTFLWRWWLNGWRWGQESILGDYWEKWTVINVLALPWFAIPLFGPIAIRWWQRRRLTRNTHQAAE